MIFVDVCCIRHSENISQWDGYKTEYHFGFPLSFLLHSKYQNPASKLAFMKLHEEVTFSIMYLPFWDMCISLAPSYLWHSVFSWQLQCLPKQRDFVTWQCSKLKAVIRHILVKSEIIHENESEISVHRCSLRCHNSKISAPLCSSLWHELNLTL